MTTESAHFAMLGMAIAEIRACVDLTDVHVSSSAKLRTIRETLSALDEGQADFPPLDIKPTKSISAYVEEICAWAKTKGWDDKLCERKAFDNVCDGGPYIEPTGVNVDAVLAKLALVISEIAEGIEHVREGSYTIRDADVVVPPMPAVLVRLARKMCMRGYSAMDEQRELDAYFDAHYDDDGNVKKPERPKPDGLAVELADVIIRVCHLAGDLGLPLQEAIDAKLEYNSGRAYRHGGKLA